MQKKSQDDPFSHSQYMRNCPSIFPLKVEQNQSIENLVEDVYAKSSYQARTLAKAAKLLVEAERNNDFVWLALSGAAAPAGLTGIVSQLVEKGYIDCIVSTGANIFHDLHYVFALPVRQGNAKVDDDSLRRDGTTRIYDTNIRNRETLIAQDMLNRIFAQRVFSYLKPPFSTATFLYNFGKELLNDTSGLVKNKKDSLLLSAASYGVPIFLDSGANHSLGMDLASLFAEGTTSDTSPSLDIIEAAAFSTYFQPQFNIFVGEGGPRNFLQTTGPTASEIFNIPFKGSEGGIILSVADERTGSLSGSTFSEAVTWGKYKSAKSENKVVVWGEYSITFPILASYLISKLPEGNRHKRLILQREIVRKDFLDRAKKYRKKRDENYSELMKELEKISNFELQARKENYGPAKS